jgi:hypothetical protein
MLHNRPFFRQTDRRIDTGGETDRQRDTGGETDRRRDRRRDR